MSYVYFNDLLRLFSFLYFNFFFKFYFSLFRTISGVCLDFIEGYKKLLETCCKNYRKTTEKNSEICLNCVFDIFLIKKNFLKIFSSSFGAFKYKF